MLRLQICEMEAWNIHHFLHRHDFYILVLPVFFNIIE